MTKPERTTLRLQLAGALLVALVMAGCQTTNTTLQVSPAAQGAGATAAPQTDAARAAQTRLELAAKYLQIGRIQRALEEVNQALVTSPNMVDAYMLRGMIYVEQRNFSADEAAYARVMRSLPADPSVLHNYGWIFCQQGYFEQGISYFDRTLATLGFSTAPRTLMAKGLCQETAGFAQQARATLELAYYADPDNPIVAYNLARLQHAAGYVSEAQSYLRPLNASGLANAETLWQGIEVENAMNNQIRVRELASLLGRRSPESREYALYERKAFYE